MLSIFCSVLLLIFIFNFDSKLQFVFVFAFENYCKVLNFYLQCKYCIQIWSFESQSKRLSAM